MMRFAIVVASCFGMTSFVQSASATVTWPRELRDSILVGCGANYADDVRESDEDANVIFLRCACVANELEKTMTPGQYIDSFLTGKAGTDAWDAKFDKAAEHCEKQHQIQID